MSLLNEMLHDLAKQKSTNAAAPSLTAALSQTEKKKINPFILGGTGLVLVLAFGMMLKPKSETPQVVKKIQEDSLIATNSVPKGSKKLAPLPTALVSSINNPKPEIAKTSSPKNIAADAQAVASENNVYHPPLERWRDSELNKATQAMNQGHVKQAKVILQEILTKEPSSVTAREKLATIYLGYGDYANASKILNAGLEYAPEDPALFNIKAKILLGQGKTKDAIELLKSDHPSMMSYPDYYATLASALQTKGLISEAGTYYKSLIKVDPSNGTYWLGYAVALEYDNKTSQAINAYKRARQSPTSELAVRDYAHERLKILQG